MKRTSAMSEAVSVLREVLAALLEDPAVRYGGRSLLHTLLHKAIDNFKDSKKGSKSTKLVAALTEILQNFEKHDYEAWLRPAVGNLFAVQNGNVRTLYTYAATIVSSSDPVQIGTLARAVACLLNTTSGQTASFGALPEHVRTSVTDKLSSALQAVLEAKKSKSSRVQLHRLLTDLWILASAGGFEYVLPIVVDACISPERSSKLSSFSRTACEVWCVHAVLRLQREKFFDTSDELATLSLSSSALWHFVNAALCAVVVLNTVSPPQSSSSLSPKLRKRLSSSKSHNFATVLDDAVHTYVTSYTRMKHLELGSEMVAALSSLPPVRDFLMQWSSVFSATMSDRHLRKWSSMRKRLSCSSFRDGVAEQLRMFLSQIHSVDDDFADDDSLENSSVSDSDNEDESGDAPERFSGSMMLGVVDDRGSQQRPHHVGNGAAPSDDASDASSDSEADLPGRAVDRGLEQLDNASDSDAASSASDVADVSETEIADAMAGYNDEHLQEEEEEEEEEMVSDDSSEGEEEVGSGAEDEELAESESAGSETGAVEEAESADNASDSDAASSTSYVSESLGSDSEAEVQLITPRGSFTKDKSPMAGSLVRTQRGPVLAVEENVDSDSGSDKAEESGASGEDESEAEESDASGEDESEAEESGASGEDESEAEESSEAEADMVSPPKTRRRATRGAATNPPSEAKAPPKRSATATAAAAAPATPLRRSKRLRQR